MSTGHGPWGRTLDLLASQIRDWQPYGLTLEDRNDGPLIFGASDTRSSSQLDMTLGVAPLIFLALQMRGRQLKRLTLEDHVDP
jgi:hypothetical protein